MAKFKPIKKTQEFNLMIALDKKMKVLKGEPNGYQDLEITVLDGYVNDEDEIIVKTVCGKEINSKYLDWQ